MLVSGCSSVIRVRETGDNPNALFLRPFRGDYVNGDTLRHLRRQIQKEGNMNMSHRYQYGSLTRGERVRIEGVWQFRYYETTREGSGAGGQRSSVC